VRLVVPALVVALAGCAPGGSGSPDASPTGSPTGSPTAPAVVPCAVDGFAPTERADVRRGTRVVVYALPLELDRGRRGRVPVTLRRLVDLRPGVRPPDAVDVDPVVLRRVAAALPEGSTGPLAETFATDVTIARAAPLPRRLVAYAATRARPFDWTAEVCGPPTTTDGSTAEVAGTGLLLGRFRSGWIDCGRVERSAGPRTAAARQLLALC
jgi:hypothetical protein